MTEKKQQAAQYRFWVCVVFPLKSQESKNFTEKDEEVSPKWWWDKYNDKIRFISGNPERCPTTERAHWQMYFELKGKGMRMTALKKWHPECHFQPRYATQQANIDYTSKEHTFDPTIGQPFTYGEPTKGQGNRKDLDLVCKDIQEGKSESYIIKNHMPQFLKYHGGIRRAISVLAYEKAEEEAKNEPFTKIKVICIWGKAETDKSKQVRQMAKEAGERLYQMPLCLKSNQAQWFEHYTNQEAILLEDFYGTTIEYEPLLQMLDGYNGVIIPVKHTNGIKKWKTVYITSNKHPGDWYIQGWTEALKRRFTTIIDRSNGIEDKVEIIEPKNGFIKELDERPPTKFLRLH